MMFISYNWASGFEMEPTSNKESLLVFIIRICVMVTLGYILRASNQRARAFPPHLSGQTCM
jgi:hypothetical protein